MNKPDLGGIFRTLDSFSGTCGFCSGTQGLVPKTKPEQPSGHGRGWVSVLTSVPTPTLCRAVSCCLKGSP